MPDADKPRKPVTVDSIMPDAKDAVDSVVVYVFAKHTPHYAIYSTDKRLGIQFADDEDEQKAQRKLIAELYPLRGQINGLVDGWRGNKAHAKFAAANRYDRRVADALTIALEGDVPNARALLEATRQDLIDERTGIARIQYLLMASLAVGVAFLLIGILARASIRALFGLPDYVPAMLVASWGGTVGAFFSIAIAIRGRTILTDLHFGNNAADAVLRVVVGLIAASILICMVQTGAVSILVGGTGATHNADLNGIIIGFLAGFSERLLPDLLARAAGDATLTPAAPPKPAAAAQAAPPNPAAAPANTPPDPADHAAQTDDCVCNHAVQPEEATPDSELPPAYGGVASR